MAKRIPSGTPERIRLTCPFGYYDDTDNLRMWQAGQVVEDLLEIVELIERGAEHEVAE